MIPEHSERDGQHDLSHTSVKKIYTRIIAVRNQGKRIFGFFMKIHYFPPRSYFLFRKINLFPEINEKKVAFLQKQKRFLPFFVDKTAAGDVYMCSNSKRKGGCPLGTGCL